MQFYNKLISHLMILSFQQHIPALMKNNHPHPQYCIYNTISNLFVRNSFKICYGIFSPQLSYWSMVGWSVVGLFGRWSDGRWSVIGWSVGRWSVGGGRLVGGFKKTQCYNIFPY